MRLWKKILIGIGVFVLVLAGLIVTFIGPWPTYSSSFEGTPYFNKAITAIDENVKLSKITDSPGRLKGGWGVASIVPAIGTPLAGYSARNSKPSTGVHDELYVKALAFSDGEDTAVVAGADMLLVPPNIAEPIREAVAKETPLKAGNLFFTASHSHDGPGGLSPGLIAGISFGKYDPKVPEMLIKSFTKAIVDAYKSMEPAKLAHGKIDAPQFIHNRTREAPCDTQLSWLVVEKDSGKRCYCVSYSAHPTCLMTTTCNSRRNIPATSSEQSNRPRGPRASFLAARSAAWGRTRRMCPAAMTSRGARPWAKGWASW